MLFDNFGNVFKQQGVRKIDHVVYIRNTHLRNHFQTATATAANTHGTYDNRISAQTVHNRLRERWRNARHPYVGCVLARLHRVNGVNLAPSRA